MKEAKEKIETANDRGEVGINIKFKEQSKKVKVLEKQLTRKDDQIKNLKESYVQAEESFKKASSIMQENVPSLKQDKAKED